MIPRIFHAFTSGFSLFIIYYWWKVLHVPPNMNLNMPNLRTNWWQYLTVWNMVSQVTYFFICSAEDFLKYTSRKALVEVKEMIEWTRETLFQAVVLPLPMGVFSIFWVTYIYDRRLIYPVEMDAVIPIWLNHVLHTTIIIFPIAELLICRRRFTKYRSRYFFGISAILTYSAMIITASYLQGYWTYPFLGLITPVQRALFFLFSKTLYTAMYVIGCKANTKVFGSEPGCAGNCSHQFADKKVS